MAHQVIELGIVDVAQPQPALHQFGGTVWIKHGDLGQAMHAGSGHIVADQRPRTQREVCQRQTG
ncbi:hypothetical protein BJQ89_03249 [Arthrobacter sp. ES1]|nr:hypothetical protein [Arthrobacter sp. ES1]